MARGDDTPASLLTLHRLPRGYRLLYSGVLLFILAGLAAGLLQQQLRAGLSPAGFADWFLGNAGDPEASRLLFARGPAEVLDAVWRRSMADVLPLVVLLALWFRSSRARWLRMGLAVLLATGTLLDLAAPALMLWGGRDFGAVAFGAGLARAGAAAAIAVLCLWEMWARRRAGPRFRPRARVRSRARAGP